MDAATANPLVTLAHLGATATDVDELVGAALPLVVSVAGARSALVVQRRGDTYETVAGTGRTLDPAALGDQPPVPAGGAAVPPAVPAAWASAGVARLDWWPLPAPGQALLLAWPERDRVETGADVDVAVDILAAGLARLVAEEELADLAARVNSAQQLANMGDYDWHIASDVNRWSDQLYRIYGHEPQSFNASYDRFLSFIHPDDRERISAIHQRAHASGEPYQMIERIVRPDGEIRYLSSNGQVVHDDTGTPVRMRGTCIDVTETIEAQRARERLAARFHGLVESAPDAILVVEADGTILLTNSRATRLLGGELVNRDMRERLTWPLTDGELLGATALDGRTLQLDVTTAALSEVEDEGLVAVFLHDAQPRLANEALAATLREAQVRRRQALEINDNVVQGLTAASFCVDQGDLAGAATFLERTLSAARRLMNDWLTPLGGEDLQAGDLVRTTPSTLDDEPLPRRPSGPAAASRRAPCRLLIADDYADMRQLMRLQLELAGGYEVVGEAVDGLEAVRLAAELQPQVVVLDLAMPGMDGLEALPLIRAAVDGVQVIALSGFDRATMAEQVLAAGAARYVEKGLSMDLTTVIDDVLTGAAAGPAAPAAP